MQNVVTYDVVVSAPNPEQLLLPGLTASVRIVTDHRDGALLVPNAALRYRPAGTGREMGAAPALQSSGVWVVGSDGPPRHVPVRVGLTDGNVTEVVEGALAPGDRVVLGEVAAGFGGPGPGLGGGPRFLTMASWLIAIEHLGKDYALGEHRVCALDDISVTIAPGEFVAVMGPSGSGKSTFMNILGCLDTPSAGRYRLDGMDLSRLDGDALARIRNRLIGFVFQGFNLLPRRSAVENVELPLVYAGVPARERRARALACLSEVGLGDRVWHQPSQLSGGQQQRVAIARALANAPRLVLADEPTGALDSRTSIEVMALFQRFNARGITIVLVTHEADIALFARRILSFRDGRLIDDQAVAAPHLASTMLAPGQSLEPAA